MQTYTHGVIGYLLYAKRSRRDQYLATIGGIVPDAFLALGFVFHYLEPRMPSAMVAELHRLLHHSALHTITVSMHSLVLVSALLAVVYRLSKPLMPFFVGMLAHGIVDLLTHRQWAYNHFFPIPLQPIGGLFSYTAVGFTIVEHVLLCVVVVWWIIQRRKRSPMRQEAEPSRLSRSE